MTEHLTPAELAAATGKARAASQAAVLARRGVPFVYSGNSVRVARAVAQAFELLPQPVAPRKRAQPSGINWAAVRCAPEPSQEEIAQAWTWLFHAYSMVKRHQDAAAARVAAYKLAAKRAIAAKRRAAERQQVPPWADQDSIRAIYAEALRLTRETGILHHVDHEIPLRGRLVSGLHVANNLRAAPALDNMRKGNRYTC